MNQRQLDAMRQRIAESPNLQKIEARLRAELLTQMGDADENNIGIDPFTILMIISIVVQVIRICQERNKRGTEFIAADMRSGHQAPLRRTIRFRRQLNKLWLEYCEKNNLAHTAFNPFLAAAYAVGSAMDEDMAAELVQLAAEL